MPEKMSLYVLIIDLLESNIYKKDIYNFHICKVFLLLLFVKLVDKTLTL